MFTVAIKIVRYISDANPGFVAGELVDTYGQVHTFEDKVPVIAVGYPNAESDYPCDGVLGCEVVERWVEDDGRKLVRIDTEKPWDIASTDAKYHFVVLAEQVSEQP